MLLQEEGTEHNLFGQCWTHHWQHKSTFCGCSKGDPTPSRIPHCPCEHPTGVPLSPDAVRPMGTNSLGHLVPMNSVQNLAHLWSSVTPGSQTQRQKILNNPTKTEMHRSPIGAETRDPREAFHGSPKEAKPPNLREGQRQRCPQRGDCLFLSLSHWRSQFWRFWPFKHSAPGILSLS